MASAVLPKVRMGNSDVMVTEVCLGTMTWGVQNTEAEAHEQLDYAIKDRGVNFIDTAEMYPSSSAPGWRPGRTEEYIGTWLAKNPGGAPGWSSPPRCRVSTLAPRPVATASILPKSTPTAVWTPSL